MSRDDAWRFLVLGRFVERLQCQTALLQAWSRLSDGSFQMWTGLLGRVCCLRGILPNVLNGDSAYTCTSIPAIQS